MGPVSHVHNISKWFLSLGTEVHSNLYRHLIFCAQKIPTSATGDECKNYAALNCISSKLMCELHRDVL